jgi:lipase chaperone LimK
MSKKYKSSIILGLFVAVVVLGFIYKTQGTNSAFVNSANQNKSAAILFNTTKATGESSELVKEAMTQQKDVVGEVPVINSIQSLNGTKIHGDLRVDSDGNLIVEKSARQLFDYFLNVTGEIPRDELIARIKQGIADYLPEPAQSQALQLFDNYLTYQLALQAEVDSGLYQVTPGNLDDLDAAHYTRSQLRSFHLGNEAATAFFAEEEARDLYTLGKLRVNANTSLSDAEREAELLALESTLPEVHQKVIHKQRSRETVRARVEELRKENADIYVLKEEWSKHYDSETVERFVKLEESRKELNGRYEEYLQKKELLAANYASEDAYTEALNQLKSSMFNETELLRVNARDRIALN